MKDEPSVRERLAVEMQEAIRNATDTHGNWEDFDVFVTIVSWRDTLDDEETLEILESYNETGQFWEEKIAERYDADELDDPEE